MYVVYIDRLDLKRFDGVFTTLSAELSWDATMRKNLNLSCHTIFILFDVLDVDTTHIIYFILF